jgi:hypothetical protein
MKNALLIEKRRELTRYRWRRHEDDVGGDLETGTANAAIS